MPATVRTPNLVPAALAAAGAARPGSPLFRTAALLSPLLLLALGLSGELRAALALGAAGRIAAREAALPQASLASIRSAAALSLGDALSPNRHSVSLAVNRGDGFRADPTGKLLSDCPRGGTVRVRITTVSDPVAQDLLGYFRLPGSCQEMRTEWVVHRE